MQLKYRVTLEESYTSILCSDGPELISDSQKHSGNVCCTQMSPHFNLFPGKVDFEFSVPKGPSRLSSAKANVCHGIWVQQSTMGDWHILGLYRAEPAQGISKLSGCLGPPRPPEAPKSSLNEITVYFILLLLLNWRYIMSMDNGNYTKARY